MPPPLILCFQMLKMYINTTSCSVRLWRQTTRVVKTVQPSQSVVNTHRPLFDNTCRMTRKSKRDGPASDHNDDKCLFVLKFCKLLCCLIYMMVYLQPVLCCYISMNIKWRKRFIRSMETQNCGWKASPRLRFDKLNRAISCIINGFVVRI